MAKSKNKAENPNTTAATNRQKFSLRPDRPWQIRLAAGLIIAVGVTAYLSSFKGGFFDDDIGSVRDNPHIRKLWPITDAMSIPLWSQYTSETVFGRPVLSLSFAVNYALSGPTLFSSYAPRYNSRDTRYELSINCAGTQQQKSNFSIFF